MPQLRSVKSHERSRDYTPKRALIVDDSNSCRVVLAGLLSRRQIQCDELTSPYDCISHLINYPDTYDYVFMDILFTGFNLNGLDVTERLRKLGYDRPIIGVTAFTEFEMRCLKRDHTATRYGLNTILTKPLIRDELFNVIETLDHWRKRHERSEKRDPSDTRP